MSDGYLGTTERAAIIRAELKAKHKWSSRDVSVKADHFSMGSAIRISIKNPAVSLAAVKEIAEAHESISRDPATGEILSGGNRYLDIGYSSEAREALAAQHLPAVEAAAAKLAEAEANHLIPVEGTGFLLGAGHHGLRYGFSLWLGGACGSHQAEVSSAKEAAILIGMGGRRS
jgi:hypothetical protein